MWNNCGMARSEASLQQALSRIPEIKEEFWNNLNVLGSGLEMNNALEQAGRVADTQRLIPDSDLNIIGEYFLEVRHNLLAVPGTNINDIKRVHSHEQGIAQCRNKIIKLNKIAINKITSKEKYSSLTKENFKSVKLIQ